MEQFVEVSERGRLWVEVSGQTDGSPLLLIMGANASGLAWPDELVAALAVRHRVIRYDHRDTGRSTWAFDIEPYSIADLAEDALAVLDDLRIARAHVVGMSMGGTLVQLLLLDHPDRLLSATVFATCALGVGLAAADHGASAELPGPDAQLLALWEQMGEPRTRAEEIDWRVEHWRLLNGDVIEFDAAEFRRLEERLIDHAGRHDNPAAHAPPTRRDSTAGRNSPPSPYPHSWSRPRKTRSTRRPTPLTSPGPSGTPGWSPWRAWAMR